MNRSDTTELDQVAGSRYGFMIADLVLRDTIEDFARGTVETEELDVALEQHRLAYEGYVKKLHECLTPVAEA